MDIHMQNYEIGPMFYSYTKINSKCIKNLNLRLKFLKLLEENIRENLHHIRLHNDFMYMTSNTVNENINKQVRL